MSLVKSGVAARTLSPQYQMQQRALAQWAVNASRTSTTAPAQQQSPMYAGTTSSAMRRGALNGGNNIANQQQQQMATASSLMSTKSTQNVQPTTVVAGDRLLAVDVRFVNALSTARQMDRHFKKALASMCVDSRCRDAGECDHCVLRLRDAAEAYDRVRAFYYAVQGFAYTVQLQPPPASIYTQWLLSNADGTASIITSLVAPAASAAGEAVVPFWYGAGFGLATRPGDLVAFSGIPDAASVTVSTKAHLLNTLYIVTSQPTTSQWNLTPLSVAFYRVGDFMQFKQYAATATLVAPITDQTTLPSAVTTFVNVNCVDQTFEWATTLYTDVQTYLVARIACVTAPKHACSSCNRNWGHSFNTPCNPSCRQCARHEVQVGIDLNINKDTVLENAAIVHEMNRLVHNKRKATGDRTATASQEDVLRVRSDLEHGRLAPLMHKQKAAAIYDVLLRKILELNGVGASGLTYNVQTKMIERGKHSDGLMMNRKDVMDYVGREASRMAYAHSLRDRHESAQGAGMLPSDYMPVAMPGDAPYRSRAVMRQEARAAAVAGNTVSAITATAPISRPSSLIAVAPLSSASPVSTPSPSSSKLAAAAAKTATTNGILDGDWLDTTAPVKPSDLVAFVQ